MRCGVVVGMAGLASACNGRLDAGYDLEQRLLPVGPENPVILCNDGASDNWQGEYALLFAQRRAPRLAGLVVSTGGVWSNLDENVAAWQDLVTRARDSGLVNVPDPTRSDGPPLRAPSDDTVESTTPNGSDGARFIVETSRSLGTPARPAVVVTGGRLTDVADAYLLDPTLAERVVVVASLGTGTRAEGGHMGVPNGEMDPWADRIVAERLRYIQVSAYYAQLGDVPDGRVAELPQNPFGAWMTAKQPELFSTMLASDQVAVIALGEPSFAKEVVRVSPAGTDEDGVVLAPDPEGDDLLVVASDGELPARALWRMLLDPATFDGAATP
jgi:hypothetical protein